MSINQQNFLFFWDTKKIQKNIFLIQKFSIKNHLNLIDFYIVDEYSIELICADFSFKIFHLKFFLNKNLNFSQNSKIENFIKIQTLAIYEKKFSSKITDLKFFYFPKFSFIKNSDKNLFDKNLFFCVTSRDGFFKIFSTNSTKEIFKYKSTELFITSVNFDLVNKLFFLTVNTNEKIIGIKFFENKEFLVKRIPLTENSICAFYQQNEERLYFLNYHNAFSSINNDHYITLFKNYKTRCRKNYSIDKIYEDVFFGFDINNTENDKVLLNNQYDLNIKDDKVFGFKVFEIEDDNGNNDSDFDKDEIDINAIDFNMDECDDFSSKMVYAFNRINRISIIY